MRRIDNVDFFDTFNDTTICPLSKTTSIRLLGACTNNPPSTDGNVDFVCKVIKESDTGYATVIATESGYGKMWMIQKAAGTWGSWAKIVTTSDLTSTVTSGSDAPITSGGVYTALQSLEPKKISGGSTLDISSLALFNTACIIAVNVTGNSHGHDLWIGNLSNYNGNYSYTSTQLSNGGGCSISISTDGVLTVTGVAYNTIVTVMDI